MAHGGNGGRKAATKRTRPEWQRRLAADCEGPVGGPVPVRSTAGATRAPGAQALGLGM